MEDYKKKYEEALERARKINSDKGVAAPPDYTICETIFPELKESEDERIRQFLIQQVTETSDEIMSYRNMNKENVLAWLEKQGESKPIGKLQLSEELYEHIRNTCACIDDALSSETLADINDYLSMAEHSAKSAFDMIEKQGEQKPADVRTTGYWHVEDIEQKPAWSEEDETKIKSIIALLKSPALCAMDGNKGVINENIKYLKSLEERMQPQPKQEWSEEDERVVESILKYYRYMREEWVNWLKSLKDGYTWKPSDEQIKVCKEVYADILSAKGFDLGTVNSELNRLEEELKKLREE